MARELKCGVFKLNDAGFGCTLYSVYCIPLEYFMYITSTNQRPSSPPCAESPPPYPVRVTPRYVVLDTSADLVLEARFRGNFHSHEWVYNENDPTFLTGSISLFSSATITTVGQTYTIPAGSASLRVGYYGPRVNPSTTDPSILPTSVNTVIVASFCKYT